MTEEDHSRDETGAAPASGAPPQKAPSAPRSGGKALGIIALVIAIAAAGVTGYLWYQVQVEQRLAQSRLVSDLKDTVNTSKVAITALEKELGTLREQHRDLAARLDNQVVSRLDALQSEQQSLTERSEALSSSIEQVYEELDRSLESWALEEVEQLLRIANQSLRLSGDVATAIAGLELADRRLEELGNPAFLEVREQLAESIASLKSLEQVDIAGLALRLSGLAGKVAELPLSQKTERTIYNESGDSGKQEAGSEDGGSNEWLEAGGELLSDLKKLVRIQNIEEPAKPLLTPEQRYFLFSNLRLMLSGAQIAALSRDTPTFRDNLEQAAQWIREYFDTGHQGVQQFLEDIEQMDGVDLDPELPDISGSLDTLQEAKRKVESR